MGGADSTGGWATVPGTSVPLTPIPGVGQPHAENRTSLNPNFKSGWGAPPTMTWGQPGAPAPVVAAPAVAPSAYTGYPGDAALLASVPAGRYTQEQRGDLTQGLADCSSAVEDLVNLLQGRSTTGASMYTGNEADWLTKHGFLPTNVPMPGTFQVGFNPEHTQATLPGGTNFNWGSDAAAQKRGIGGSGAWDPAFTQHYYLPVGPNTGSPTGVPPGVPAPVMPDTKGKSADDPMYVALPDKQVQQMSNSPASQLGQDFLGGIGQVFGLDGSVFKDPTQFGLFKIFKAAMGLKMKGGDGSSVDGSIPGGGGGSVLSGLLGPLSGLIPQPFGNLQPGSPTDAPGQFMPLLPGAGGGGGIDFPSIAQSGQKGAPGPGNQIDNSVNFYGPVGNPQSAFSAATGWTVPQIRQGLRPLP